MISCRRGSRWLGGGALKGVASFLSAAAVTLAATPLFAAAPLNGLWDASVTVNGEQIPFRFRLVDGPAGPRGVFFDGERPINPSSDGVFRDGRLLLTFADYASKLEARLEDGVLKGTFSSARASYPFEAHPHKAVAGSAGRAPNIAGDWEIPFSSRKGEKAWKLIVQQKGPRLYASILRIDGDTGTISGDWRGDRFALSHFAGERPEVLEITPKADGTLGLLLIDGSERTVLQAQRPALARKAGLAAPSDPKHFTSVRDPNEIFRFSGADFDGRTVTNADRRFRNKVVLVNITGSWCPNCHDEAPFLAALYRKYRARGLEIVGLDYEQPDQLQNPTRLKAFITRYKLDYTVLLAGDTRDLNKTLPQAVNLNAWPTSFFLGRDGKVKSVHVGFTSPGSAAHDAELKAELVHEIEGLLAEKG